VELIDRENRMNESRIIYNYHNTKKLYIYAKCKTKGCKAELRFKRKNEEEIYHLFKE
jgi:hypothetical protein